FETVGIKPLRGRVIESIDRDSMPPVAVVNQSFVKKYYPSGEAIGHRIRRVGSATLPWLEIVGVVPDVMDAGVGVALGPSIYLSMVQSNTSALSLVYRTPLTQPAAEKAVRQALHRT